jgi:hypothetical protein
VRCADSCVPLHWWAWAASSGRLPCTFLAYAFLLALQPRIVSAQIENPAAQPSLTQQIESLQLKEQLLVQRLSERSNQVSDLEQSLKRARQKSNDSAASSAELEKKLALAKALQYSSEMGLQATLSSLDQLQTTRQRSAAAFQAYRQEMQGQVNEIRGERDAWQLASWASIGAAVSAITVAAIGGDPALVAVGALAGGAIGAGARLVLR